MTDHRIKLTLYKIDSIMNGDITELLDSLIAADQAAKLAKEGGYDYFTTTLSISPLKNAQKINEIGEELAEIYKVPHLTSDFKKKNGYKRSIELSHEHALYRQNYCGCVFSKKEAMDRERLVTENRVNSNNG